MIKLTQTVKKGGCAAKVPAMILKEILSGLTFPPLIEGITVDGSLFDDAAIYELNSEIALVQTLDFFTPILNSPYDFGAVSAANSLSDVYAMGGLPKTCMAILAAPLATLEPKIIQEVLQGASDIISKAKASLVGGHSIDDETLKFGLSVTGIVHPEKVWKNKGARPGDILILTKPIGTGTLCAGLKKDIFTESEIEDAIESMKMLNNVINYLSVDSCKYIHSATDITGFGLAGHCMQMAKASKVNVEITSLKIPFFLKTLQSLEMGNLTKAHKSNEEYTKVSSILSKQISSQHKLALYDPQTSGGLLLAVDPKGANRILDEMTLHFPHTSIIGQITSKDPLNEHYLHVE